MQNANHKLLTVSTILLFAAVSTALLLTTLAAPNATATIDFSQLADQPNFYHYERNHIKIRRITSAKDEALLADINTNYERSFVRLDQWKPNPNSQLNTDPRAEFTLGDTFIDSANRRGTSIWITQEVSKWKNQQRSGSDLWFIEPPLSDQDLQQYEDIWYEILTYIKTRSPNTEVAEQMNEPNLQKFKLTQDDQWKLYVSHARVVNRVNNDLNLPNAQYGKKLLKGGPSFTFSQHIPPNGGEPKFKYWVDKISEHPEFQQIKPDFYSFHRFGPKGDPEQYGEDPQVIRNYLKTKPGWENMPLWVSAYSNYGDNSIDNDPTATEMASTAAGIAAVHKLYMDNDVVNNTIFAQSAYNAYEGSVLLPKHNDGRPISFYEPGRKTPVYNYFKMMSMIDDNAKRVSTRLNNSNPLNNGNGLGIDGIRSNNKAYVFGWNYQDDGSNASLDRDVTFRLENLSAAGIDVDETADYKIYAIDRVNSNIGAGNHSSDDLEVVATGTLGTGNNRQINYSVLISSVILIEITGNNDGSGGTGGDPVTTPLEAESANVQAPAARRNDLDASDKQYVEFNN